jgi:mRNA-degrading endonuclease RelE of RelBE toxin-antitoxin system
MKHEVSLSDAMKKAIRKLIKKYPKVLKDINPLIEQLEQGIFEGDKIQGFAGDVYKVRIASTDQKKGKRGGFRVIYYVITQDKNVILLTMYTKAHKENITDEEIKNILDEIES